MATYQYLDLNDAMKRLGGNLVIYKRLLTMFLAGPEFDAYEKSVRDGDVEEQAKTIHAIKGLAGNLSLIPLFKESASLMDAYRSGSVTDAAIDRYRVALEATKKEVNQYIKEN